MQQDGSEASKVVAELRKEKHEARLTKAREAAANAHTQAKVLRKATCAPKAKAKAKAKAAEEEIAESQTWGWLLLLVMCRQQSVAFTLAISLGRIVLSMSR